MEQKNEIVISFNQIKHITENQSKIQAYEQRFYEVLRTFQKNPFMQFLAFGVYSELLDLSTYVYNKDYSQLLFDKLDKVFNDFEEFQANEKFTELKKLTLETIKKCNEVGVFNFKEK